MSDGYAHALEFAVNGKTSGDELQLATSGKVTVTAAGRVFAGNAARAGLRRRDSGRRPPARRRHRHQAGNAVARSAAYQRGQRLVEVVVNGRAVASREVPADGREHAVEFSVPIERSSWIAMRQFPQLHTNPVTVLVGGKPIRASRESAQWALACIDQLWRVRARQDCAERARRRGKGIRRGEGSVPADCRRVACGPVTPNEGSSSRTG